MESLHAHHHMIELTRLNGESFKLNVFLIEQIQSCPDTTITLTSRKNLVVSESEDDVTTRIMRVYQMIGLYGFQARTGDEHE
ncbi:flagellar FlbD family protein [Lentibacillus saliphilus]|uniref:flagellar FlbD family protein n=1 Tax=Lentibacillus saliphilus TaxID=2737028 RepID=UPI003CCEBD5A